MPRSARSLIGGYVYHVLNRAVVRRTLFDDHRDYAAFEKVLSEAHQRVPLRLLSYTVMPNHWHFVVWPRPRADTQVSDFFGWLTLTHSQRWHAHRGSSGTGHVYQGRFKSFPVEGDEHLLHVLRYVERNPLRANLVSIAEQWTWGSLFRRVHGTVAQRQLLTDPPVNCGTDWTSQVNQPQSEAELAALRASVARERPYGGVEWRAQLRLRMGCSGSTRVENRPPAS
jgi:putative transposase